MSSQTTSPADRRRLIDGVGWWLFGLALGICLAIASAWIATGAWVGAGFFAKQLCSGVFVSGRDPRQIIDSDLKLYMPALIHRPMGWKIDDRTGTVRAHWMKGMVREARFKGAQGCELVYDRAGPSAFAVGATRVALADPLDTAASHGIGSGATSRSAVSVHDREALSALIDEAFDEKAGYGTRAVIVVHRGAVVAERYAAGFDAGTRFPGWSLSKSVMNGMIGALVQQGRVHVDDPVPVSAWRAAGDRRSGVTYDHLLRMSSGLRFNEDYESPFSDVTRMLFAEPDASVYAESRPLVAPPGTVWSYSSGSTMVLAHALAAYADSRSAYAAMPRRLLFEKIGMHSAVMETDARGTFEATSSVYATALDWARFGWLYAKGGVWNGKRVLPSGWVQYSATPSASDPSGRYGAHFWIYTDADRAVVQRSGVLPPDAFYAEGFGGQRITIAPTDQAVIVRLGAANDADQRFDNTLFAAKLLRALGIEAPSHHIRVAAGDGRDG